MRAFRTALPDPILFKQAVIYSWRGGKLGNWLPSENSSNYSPPSRKCSRICRSEGGFCPKNLLHREQGDSSVTQNVPSE